MGSASLRQALGGAPDRRATEPYRFVGRGSSGTADRRDAGAHRRAFPEPEEAAPIEQARTECRRPAGVFHAAVVRRVRPGARTAPHEPHAEVADDA